MSPFRTMTPLPEPLHGPPDKPKTCTGECSCECGHPCSTHHWINSEFIDCGGAGRTDQPMHHTAVCKCARFRLREDAPLLIVRCVPTPKGVMKAQASWGPMRTREIPSAWYIPTVGGFAACTVGTAAWASGLAPLWLAWLLGVAMGVGVNFGGFLGRRWWG